MVIRCISRLTKLIFQEITFKKYKDFSGLENEFEMNLFNQDKNLKELEEEITTYFDIILANLNKMLTGDYQ